MHVGRYGGALIVGFAGNGYQKAYLEVGSW